MTSIHTPTDPPRRLLGLWAHPDDESYLSAGLMDRVVRAGGQVTVVTLTDGEAGFPEDDPRSAEELRRLRRSELRAALGVYGVDDVRFLGIPDGGLSTAPEAPLVDALEAVVREVRPDVVVTFGPDGITGHDDHTTTSRLAGEAWRRVGHGELWHAAKTDGWLARWRELHDRLGVWMTEEPTGVPEDEIALLLDLAPAEIERKRAALAAHGSQSDIVAAAMGEATYRRWIDQETFRLPLAAGVLR